MMKITILVLVLLLLLGIASFLVRESKAVAEDRVAAALVALSKRTNDDAFVIITAKPTERYVQFSVRGNQTVYFDVPLFAQDKPGKYSVLQYDEVAEIPKGFGGTKTRYISRDEETRLKAYLAKRGISYAVVLVAGKGPDGVITSYMQSLTGDLTIPVSAYRGFVQGIFQNVYRLDEPWQLEIEDN